MKNLLMICIAVLISGCASKDYLQAQNECSPAAYQQFPVKNVQMYVQRTKSVPVPTGAEECESRTDGGRTYTRCKPETRMRSVPYQSLEWVDTNKQARAAYLKNCAAQLCVKRFGNQECANGASQASAASVSKTVKSDVPSSPAKPVSKSSGQSDDDDDD